MPTDKDIQALVRASIETKIIEAFRETPEMVDELVRACLSDPVTENGVPPKFHSDKSMPYLSWLAKNTVKQVADQAVRDMVKEIEPQIREQVKEALAKTHVGDAFVQSILSATQRDWAIKVSFQQESR